MRVGDTAIFCVELAGPEGSVRWLWNQEEVVAGGRVSISNEGTSHTLTISQCGLSDAGEVAFVANSCRTSTQFCVSGKGQEVPYPGWRQRPESSPQHACLHTLLVARRPVVLSWVGGGPGYQGVLGCPSG